MGFQPRRDTVAFLHPATSRHPHPPKLQKITHTPRLILVYDEMIKQLTLELTDLAKKAVPSLLALQGLGALTAAKILGEVGDIRRFPSRSKFASYCGVAPVEASSGERGTAAPGGRRAKRRVGDTRRRTGRSTLRFLSPFSPSRATARPH